MRGSLGWAVLVMALAACGPRGGEGEAGPVSSDTAEVTGSGAEVAVSAAASGVDREAEAQAIRELNRRWVAAVAARDTATIAEFYAPEGRLMPQGVEAAEGRDAVRAAWAGLLATPGLELTFAPHTVEIAESGDMAYEIGTYEMRFDGPDGHVVDRGKYVVVWEKREGAWKAVIDIVNSDVRGG